jgi:hypothetical protein
VTKNPNAPQHAAANCAAACFDRHIRAAGVVAEFPRGPCARAESTGLVTTHTFELKVFVWCLAYAYSEPIQATERIAQYIDETCIILQ